MNLLEAAKAVVARWDSPKWKDQPSTSKFINDLRVAIEAAEKPCTWTLDNTDRFYHTACDNSFVLNDGTPAENDMRFCPYCAGRIEEKEETPWE